MLPPPSLKVVNSLVKRAHVHETHSNHLCYLDRRRDVTPPGSNFFYLDNINM